MFKLDQIDLEFDKEFLMAIAKQCLQQKIGARGLRSVLENKLLALQYELPKLKFTGVTGVNIDPTGKPQYLKG